MKPITRLLLMLPGARQKGNVWSTRCPAHDDDQASLAIEESADGRAIVDCRAGCRADAICRAVGLQAAEIVMTNSKANGDGGCRTPAHTLAAAAPDLLHEVAEPLPVADVAHGAEAAGPALNGEESTAAADETIAAFGGERGSARRQAVAKIVRLSGVVPKPIRWLWPGRIALGKLTLLSGDPGLGKSFLSCDLAARVSTGSNWPDDVRSAAPRGGVVLLNCEDDLADTIRPRLDRHGADVSRIIALAGVRDRSNHERERPFDLARDLPALESAIRDVGDCRLVAIDPVTAYLGDRHDSHKTADVRALLAPLAALAARYETAVVAISHLNKSQGAAMYRTTGSLAFVAAARAAWCVTRDRENPARRLLLPIKNNLGNDRAGLAYSICDGRVAWEAGPVSVSADEALGAKAERSPGPEPAVEAEAWLKAVLTPGMPMASKVVMADARECGITAKRLREAARRLGVTFEKSGMTGCWTWALPEDSAGDTPPR
jgi:hypothetical protein